MSRFKFIVWGRKGWYRREYNRAANWLLVALILAPTTFILIAGILVTGNLALEWPIRLLTVATFTSGFVFGSLVTLCSVDNNERKLATESGKSTKGGKR